MYAALELPKVRPNSPIIGTEQHVDYACIEFSAPPAPIEEPEPPPDYMTSRDKWVPNSYNREKL